ncbi:MULTISPECIES: hypothetical protein [unclassified Arthrobacter]|uniref:hypothetical protein n=1 Tax=unclassified Arthrobacter TaxID=235627 RepID=UPI001D146859|nr:MULTISPECIES: hypothetical protein [unclassified Arthrobacter]MCC3274592.1 hypothetical protein [Arthrobacter sp. zg-Y20]MCC3279432.1 hypothetical protein [Arthrobacter sp. zg-Y40]MCC9177819.1 hypothetical protein [Arthrobacter sp. zg-Y750]MDK1314749.1 hypothetical protein [Arthrobacter sp. zg.Y20]MDK1327616.1 hypothetical protein [Arthrobacter sp. zg-Y1143]
MSTKEEAWPHLGAAWLVQAAAALALAVAVVLLQLWVLPEPVLVTVLLAVILGALVMLLLAVPELFGWIRRRFERTWLVVSLMGVVAVVCGWLLVITFVLGFGLLVIGFG